MPIAFPNSTTKDNLMRAFAGESQARNRYTLAAEVARAQKLPCLEKLFLFTADQELAHAAVFYRHLKELSGQNILVDGSYPVDVVQSMDTLLRAAQKHEYEEHDSIYKSFGEIAQQEGFPQVATSFFSIAAIEKTHGDRFGRFAAWVEQEQLFTDPSPRSWMCSNCGHIYTGREAPWICPVCNHDRGYFLRLDEMPFSGRD